MFKIFHTNRPIYSEDPIIVITWNSKGNELFTEVFVFINDDNNEFFAQRQTAKRTIIPEYGFKINNNFMFNNAKETALTQLRVRQAEIFLKTKNDIFYKQRYSELIALNKSEGIRVIIRLRLQNKNAKELEIISKQSVDSELKDLIKSVLKIKPISTETV